MKLSSESPGKFDEKKNIQSYVPYYKKNVSLNNFKINLKDI